MLFLSRFFLLQTLRYKKPKFIYVSESKSFFFDACSHERRRRRRQKRTRPAKNAFVVSWWRWWWSKSCLSVSSSNRELSPLFETASSSNSCRDPHKKKGGDIFAIISIRRTHTQHRERPTVVVTLPVFFAAFGTTRHHAKPKRGCAQ